MKAIITKYHSVGKLETTKMCFSWLHIGKSMVNSQQAWCLLMVTWRLLAGSIHGRKGTVYFFFHSLIRIQIPIVRALPLLLSKCPTFENSHLGTLCQHINLGQSSAHSTVELNPSSGLRQAKPCVRHGEMRGDESMPFLTNLN